MFFYLLADLCLLFLASFAATCLSRHGSADSNLHDWLDDGALLMGLPFLFLVFARTYRRVWSQARIWEFVFLLMVLATGVTIAEAFVATGDSQGSKSFLVHLSLYCGFASVALVLIRILPRLAQDLMPLLREYYSKRGGIQSRTAIYPAGPGAVALIQAQLIPARHDNVRRIVGLLSDDSNLHGRLIAGYNVLSGIDTLDKTVVRHKIQEIIVTAEATDADCRKVVDAARRCGIVVSRWEAHLTTLTDGR
ncbi:MAG: hypothetical protein WCP86_05770 [bacterium]